MKYQFTEIQTELAPNDNIKLTLFDLENEVSVEMLVSENKLIDWYFTEFAFVDRKGFLRFCTIKTWYEEYLKGNENKAWDIWERANIENLTFNTIE